MERLRSTKVIGTIGPACESPELIRELLLAGMNVARLNFSHGDHATHGRLAERVREAASELGMHVAVMLDTRGPEIRTGTLGGVTVQLEPGSPFQLYVDGRRGDRFGVSVTHEELPGEVASGASIFLDDGSIELRVDAIAKDSVGCTVVRGGELGERKGVSIPGATLSLPSVSEADVADLRFAAELQADYVAASFIRTSDDIAAIRRVLTDAGLDIPVLAKIESQKAVENLQSIISAADGTMVARGDLGVELPVQRVPLEQKRIIRETVMAGKPVITATQMLDSMERSPRPTRAEASDVANAILDGTSAVMLSGETAMGLYPVESVRMMAAIAHEAESGLATYGDLQQIGPQHHDRVTDAVAQAAVTIAQRANAAAILTLTETGNTSREICKYRPGCPILAVTSSPRVVRRLSLNWGVRGLLAPEALSDEEKIDFGVARATDLGVAAGEVVVITAGISRATGSTNLVRVVRL